jgi:molecular chaperone DnaJ
MEVSFKDAAFGTKAEISYEREAVCSVCKGSGTTSGSGRKTCTTCGGAGQVRRSSGFFSLTSVCPTCQGQGTIIENPCSTCGGRGVAKKRQRIKVTIPAGIANGQRITIHGQGDDAPQGGDTGDLHVIVHVAPHRHFERAGNDVHCVVPISVTQAALGAEIKVPTIDDKRVRLKIPGGTQNGKVLRLRGEGIPALNSNRRGDLYVRLQVVIPKHLNGRSKQLLRVLAEIEGENSDPEPIALSELG